MLDTAVLNHLANQAEVLPRLLHARNCQCWLCSSDLSCLDESERLTKTALEDAVDERADQLWLESLSPDKLEQEWAERCAEGL
mgnify:FL=1